MTTETMDTPTTGLPTSIPTSYEFTPRPAASPRASNVDPSLLHDLRVTLQNGQAIAFDVDGAEDRQILRLAARLNNVGRRSGGEFTVRTRRQGSRLFAWAVPTQPQRPRSRKPQE